MLKLSEITAKPESPGPVELDGTLGVVVTGGGATGAGAVLGGGVTGAGAVAGGGVGATGSGGGGVAAAGVVAAGVVAAAGGIVLTPDPTVTKLDAVCRSATALIVAIPLWTPLTRPVTDTVAIVVSLDVHRASAPIVLVKRSPPASTTVVASLTVTPMPMVETLGVTSTDADGAGSVYTAAVRSVTSELLLFASVPAHAAAARMSAVSTVLVLRFTVRSSVKRHSVTRLAWRAIARFSLVVLRPRLSAGLPLSWPLRA